MFQCNLCDFSTDSRERFAGHRSSHVRRGDMPKRIRHPAEHKCQHCGEIFDSGPRLAGHLSRHRVRPFRTWEELTTNGQRKQRLLQERGHQCEICGITEWCGKPTPIELDHIDGNHEYNNKNNLRLLCVNCHAQTPTYKGRNIGKHDTKISAYRRAYHKSHKRS